MAEFQIYAGKFSAGIVLQSFAVEIQHQHQQSINASSQRACVEPISLFVELLIPGSRCHLKDVRFPINMCKKCKICAQCDNCSEKTLSGEKKN